MLDLTIGRQGELVLPGELRARYGLLPETPVRVFETHSGILIIPVTDEPMSAELKAELDEWQTIGEYDSLC